MSNRSHSDSSASITLIDRLWQLKRVAEQHLGIRVPTNMLINNESYRASIIEQLHYVDDPAVKNLIADIQQIQARIHKRKKTDSETTPAAVNTPEKTKKSLLRPALLAACFVLLAGIIGLQFFHYSGMPQASATITEPGAATPALPDNDPLVYFRLHGSNTVGEKLAPMLLEAFIRNQGGQHLIWHQGEHAVERNLQFVLDNQWYFIELKAHGSGTAFNHLDSSNSFGMSSRPIRDSEQQQWINTATGNLRAANNEHIVALDGLAVIVHPSNPISQITSDKLAAIFSGQISNWKELGGADATITILARDSLSGTWDTFKSLVLDPYKQSLANSARRYESSTALSDDVAADAAAIGFIGLPYVRKAKLLAIAENSESLAIIPTRFTVSTEDYPLARRLFLYTPQHAIAAIKAFVDFAVGMEGQRLAEETGLISQNIRMEETFRIGSAPELYNQYAERAQRLSLNFRFQLGSDDLDNKSQRDLKRLVDFMAERSGQPLILLGFSDSTGSANINDTLSLRRAKMIERTLMSHGINVVDVLGLGSAMPVASNETDAGRSRNRRVEVWIMAAPSLPSTARR